MEIAGVAWAFASTAQADMQLFKSLAVMAVRHMISFSAQSAATTFQKVAWAFVTAYEADQPLFKDLAMVTMQRLVTWAAD